MLLILLRQSFWILGQANSISVDVMKHDMRSTCINYKKMEIECTILTKYSYRVAKKDETPYYLFACKSVISEIS